MGFETPNFETKKTTEFRQLVGSLVESSDLFEEWVSPVNPSDKMSIIDAIENNRITDFTGEYISDKKHDAINCLIAIHDELEKTDTDEDFIEQTVAQLKEYL
jgi:hypothetical protein